MPHPRVAFSKPFLAIFLTAALTFTPLLQGIALANDGFTDVKIAPGLATSSNFIDVLVPFLSNHPETDEGRGEMSLDVKKVDGKFRVEITKKGYLDDSVGGEIFQGTVIRNADGLWELLEMRVKPICWRGEPNSGRCP